MQLSWITAGPAIATGFLKILSSGRWLPTDGRLIPRTKNAKSVANSGYASARNATLSWPSRHVATAGGCQSLAPAMLRSPTVSWGWSSGAERRLHSTIQQPVHAGMACSRSLRVIAVTSRDGRRTDTGRSSAATHHGGPSLSRSQLVLKFIAGSSPDRSHSPKHVIEARHEPGPQPRLGAALRRDRHQRLSLRRRRQVPADQMAQRQRYECRSHRRNVEPVARFTGRHRPA